MRLRALAVLGGLVLLLLLPAAALAQSAGDKQYSDPFGDKSPSSGSAPSGSAPSSSPTAQAPSSSPTTDSGSQVASNSASGSSSTDSSSSSGSLPRTGLRAWLLAAMGAFMLVAGAFLRFVARPLRVRVGSLSPPVLGRDVRLTRTRR